MSSIPSDGEESDDFRSDVRYADTTETLGSGQLATAENYQLDSVAPLVRNVSEEEKRFVGDLTEIGSPVTDSENPSSAVSHPGGESSGVWWARQQRDRGRGASQEKEADDKPLLETASATTESTATAQLSIEVMLDAAEAQRSPTSSPQLQHHDDDQQQLLLLPPGDSHHARPMRRVERHAWRDETSSCEEDTGDFEYSLLPGGSRSKGSATAAAASDEEEQTSTREDGVLRTRFEATFDQPPKLPIRLLQRFDVTYEKRPSEPHQQQQQPELREMQPQHKPTEVTLPMRTPSEDPLAKWNINEMITSATENVNKPKRQEQKSHGGLLTTSKDIRADSESSGEDADFATFTEDDFLSLPKVRQPSAHAGAKSSNIVRQQDSELFDRLLENLEKMMRGADETMGRPNVYNVRKLVSKDMAEYCSQKDSRLCSRKFQTSTVIQNPIEDATLLESPLEEGSGGAGGGGPDGGGSGSSSADSSPEDTVSIAEDAVAPSGERRRHHGRPHERSGKGFSVRAKPKEEPDPIHGINQVCSTYLAGDSHEQVKRQIAYHYLAHAYGGTHSTQRTERDEVEAARLKRKSQLKSGRLSRGFRYCNYLLPFVFVLAIFGVITYCALQILMCQDCAMSFYIVMFSMCGVAGALLYCYNIFAPEEYTI